MTKTSTKVVKKLSKILKALIYLGFQRVQISPSPPNKKALKMLKNPVFSRLFPLFKFSVFLRISPYFSNIKVVKKLSEFFKVKFQ